MCYHRQCVLERYARNVTARERVATPLEPGTRPHRRFDAIAGRDAVQQTSREQLRRASYQHAQ
jgi:hypothetical protein